MQEIKVVIGKNNKVVIDVQGVKGSGCKDLTKAIENALGSVDSDKKKSEFYEQNTLNNTQKQY